MKNTPSLPCTNMLTPHKRLNVSFTQPASAFPKALDFLFCAISHWLIFCSRHHHKYYEGDIMYKNAIDCWPGLESHHLILIMSSLLQSPKSFCSPLNSGRRVKCHKDGAGGTRHTWIVLDPQTSDAGASRLSAATCLRTEEHALLKAESA